MKKHAAFNVVKMPPRCGETSAMLRALADDIDQGEFGEDVTALVVICGDEFQVRGFGRIGGMEAVGYLHLGADHITRMTLRGLDDA